MLTTNILRHSLEYYCQCPPLSKLFKRALPIREAGRTSNSDALGSLLCFLRLFCVIAAIPQAKGTCLFIFFSSDDTRRVLHHLPNIARWGGHCPSEVDI